MRLYYYDAPKKNFGDDLNKWLWDKLLPNFFDNSQDSWVSVIGTIINNEMPKAKNKYVFSSGAGYGAPPQNFDDSSWNIICVRGPLTAEVLGLKEDLAVTDGAILLAALPEYKPLPETERKGIVFMPHHRALDYGYWEEVCKRSDIEFISPREDSKKILERLRSAKLVLADAMHAAIAADTLRVPWIPIVASSSINGFKWHDWAASMALEYSPDEIPSSNLKEISTRIPLNILGGLHPGGDTIEKAIKDYQKKLTKNNITTANLDKKVRLALAKGLRIASQVSENIYIGTLLDDRLISNAARSLSSVSKKTAFLSSDYVFSRKLDQMQEKLQILRSIRN